MQVVAGVLVTVAKVVLAVAKSDALAIVDEVATALVAKIKSK